ncbi:MAG TPA: hypothetical protein VLA68_03750 [Nitrososphaera sp.]|nr:hypothetical protein [Nitrososphaera sp.]
MREALGCTGMTVFRKLKSLGYHSSYSHRGCYYTLESMAKFDSYGLWSHESVCFSRYGTLLDTAETFIDRAQKGYFAEELAQVLHVEVQDALLKLVRRHRIFRQEFRSKFLYTSVHRDVRKRQLITRRTAESVPIVVDVSSLEIPPEELKAAIILFYSLLDEQQRRLYAGLESIKLGRGGDQQLADFLGVNAQTVSRGRQQLLDQQVQPDRVRRTGGGRISAEKKTRSDQDH